MKLTGALPPQLLEASNGFMLVILANMFAFCVDYLWRRVREDGLRACFRDYRFNAIVGLSVLFGALFTRAAVIWMVRHIANSPGGLWDRLVELIVSDATIVMLVPWLIVLTTVGVGIGGICYMRWMTGRIFGVRAWILLFLVATLFGLVNAVDLTRWAAF